MTVVVTGGSGHIGANGQDAVEQGRDVRVVYHRYKGLLADFDVEWVRVM